MSSCSVSLKGNLFVKFEPFPWEKMSLNANPIELYDDKAGASDATYRANNPDEKSLDCYEPEKAESGCPRCDYLLVHRAASGRTVRFIELKGGDSPPRRGEKLCAQGCQQTWAHAFHQLFATYESCAGCIDGDDDVGMILCTSWDKNHKKPYAKYKQYRYYKAIRNIERFDIVPQVMYRDCVDSI